MSLVVSVIPVMETTCTAILALVWAIAVTVISRVAHFLAFLSTGTRLVSHTASADFRAAGVTCY
jgi:hypothetical protein